MTEVWAHRGSRTRAPENTIAAFEAAIEDGADGIELDVHLTADGRLAVRHDPTVVLPDGSVARIEHLEWAVVSSADVGEPGAPARVPALEEVLELLAPTGLRVNVEAKTTDALYPGIVPALVRAWRGGGCADRVVFSSFNHHTLLELRAADHGVEVAPLVADGLVDPWVYLTHLGMTTFHPHYALLSVPGMLDGLRAHGVASRAWTVNDGATQRELARAGVAALIVDDPRAARAAIEAR